MNENEFPDNKIVLKRALIALLVIAVVIIIIAGLKYNLLTMIWFISSIVAIVLIVLFIRLCIDVHSIAESMKKANQNDDN